ncbi:hypothetical protein BSPWISOXPB_826 [uncultured Gammaproteobacteria bacterium]|nr:hypothetical protein BSPWISOXPB_826 [uncultured Gammaproteobacteria bacterium]
MVTVTGVNDNDAVRETVIIVMLFLVAVTILSVWLALLPQ